MAGPEVKGRGPAVRLECVVEGRAVVIKGMLQDLVHGPVSSSIDRESATEWHAIYALIDLPYPVASGAHVFTQVGTQLMSKAEMAHSKSNDLRCCQAYICIGLGNFEEMSTKSEGQDIALLKLLLNETQRCEHTGRHRGAFALLMAKETLNVHCTEKSDVPF